MLLQKVHHFYFDLDFPLPLVIFFDSVPGLLFQKIWWRSSFFVYSFKPILTLWCVTSQNGQTHFNNFASDHFGTLSVSDHFGTLYNEGLRNQVVTEESIFSICSNLGQLKSNHRNTNVLGVI